MSVEAIVPNIRIAFILKKCSSVDLASVILITSSTTTILQEFGICLLLTAYALAMLHH